MLKQLQDLVDTLQSDEDLKHLEIEIDETCASVEIVSGLNKYYETFELSCDSSNEKFDLMIVKPFSHGEMMTSVSMRRLIENEVEFCIYLDRIVFYNVNVSLEKLIRLLKFLLIAVDRQKGITMIKHEHISYTLEKDDFLYFEEDGTIRQIQIDQEHLIEKKPIINRFAIISYLAVLQEDDGALRLFDLDKKSFEKSGLFADKDLLKKKIIQRQLAEFDSQFDRFQIEDFYRKRVFKKFAIDESEEMKECLRAYQNMLVPVLVYVIDKSGEKIHYNKYQSLRRDASHVKYDNLLETIDFI